MDTLTTEISVSLLSLLIGGFIAFVIGVMYGTLNTYFAKKESLTERETGKIYMRVYSTLRKELKEEQEAKDKQ